MYEICVLTLVERALICSLYTNLYDITTFECAYAYMLNYINLIKNPINVTLNIFDYEKVAKKRVFE